MNPKNRLLFGVCFLLIIGNTLQAQRGFKIPDGKRVMEVPFELTNNFIVIHLILNNQVPVNFVFDSGAGQTIVTKKELTDRLSIKYERSFPVLGSDLSKPLTAFLCRNIRLEIPDRILAPQEDILVLEEDFFQFEEYTGITIHGILSANAFSSYLIKINYDRKVITLYEREYFNPKEMRGFQKVPIEIYRDKPYFLADLQMAPDSVVRVKLLIDTGAGMPLLLFAHTHPLLHPPANAISSNIGMGLGGNIAGFIGRTPNLSLGNYQEKNIITYFQQLDTSLLAETTYSRNGIVGNGMLSRFVVFLDYFGHEMWLKPGKKYKSEYTYDRSGLNIIAAGTSMSNYIVQYVVPQSPAAEADIREGDRIVKIGKHPAFLVSLSHIISKLHGKSGRKINLTVERSGEKYKKTIILRDIL